MPTNLMTLSDLIGRLSLGFKRSLAGGLSHPRDLTPFAFRSPDASCELREIFGSLPAGRTGAIEAIGDRAIEHTVDLAPRAQVVRPLLDPEDVLPYAADGDCSLLPCRFAPRFGHCANLAWNDDRGTTLATALHRLHHQRAGTVQTAVASGSGGRTRLEPRTR